MIRVKNDAEFQAQQRALLKRLKELKTAVMEEIPRAVEREAINLVRYVQKNKLNGQILNVISGRLRRSITYKMSQEGEKITALVGTNVVYARVHEYGFSGSQSVKSFIRRQTKAFGKDINPIDVVVRAHTRNVNLKARPFLGPSLNENRERIVTNVMRAIKDARAKAVS